MPQLRAGVQQVGQIVLGFAAGEYDTGFIEREKAVLCDASIPEGDALDLALAVAAID
jgi:hypothetical protein